MLEYKDKVAKINKETFIQVATIIMENRKDGDNLSWKWVQENQRIPFEEFTSFYKDLSGFIETQRQGYFNLEKECQSIATANNMLLDSFPNNVYNIVLRRPYIKYEYGFTSEITDRIFATKKEEVSPD